MAYYSPVEFHARRRIKAAACAGDVYAYTRTGMCTNYYALRMTPLSTAMSSNPLHSLLDLHCYYDRRVMSLLKANVRELRSIARTY